MPPSLDERRFGPKAWVISALGRLVTIKRLAAFLHFWARLVVLVRKPFIIGVTGSVGKTTTTEMVYSVLKQRDIESMMGQVGHAENNMNDDLGLPATLLLFGDLKEDYPPSRLATAFLAPFRTMQILAGARQYPKVFVLEFGASWDGHIARLAHLAPPNIAVVTTIGAAHLERLKNLEGVAREKMALVQAVPPSGLVILGNDHDFVSRFAQAAKSPVVEVDGKGIEFAENATRVICSHLRIPDALVATGIRAFKPPKGRLNVLKLGRITIIDDSYNANPLSMKFGLHTLARTAAFDERRVAILGFMAELGDKGPQYHKEIGTVARSCVDLLIGVGELAKYYDADMWFDSSESCAEQIERFLRPSDIVLIKGSGSASMRKIVEKVRESAQDKSDDSISGQSAACPSTK